MTITRMHPFLGRVRRAMRQLTQPVPNEKRRIMRARWDALDPRWRTVGQGFGRQATGCGATIGLHPRCDFACAGCYLGSEANRVRPIGRPDAFQQLDRLRAWLGPKGNTQITDGEVTLLPPDDLVAIIRYARQIGLIPMVMSHGDTFRRRRGLLERLMVEGGLTEVSFHIDTTQRGRHGYRASAEESALTPLREECAAMIREARRTTGLPLRAATTLTVTRDNLPGIAAVVEWCLRNRDAFGMLSFQPVAQVGRTDVALPGITVEELWATIGDVLGRYGCRRRAPGPVTFGHPDCTRVEMVAVVERTGCPPRVVPIIREDQPKDTEMLQAFFDRGLGGINFRDDSRLDRVCRAIGAFGIAPFWCLGPLRRWSLERLDDINVHPLRLAWEAARGRLSVGGFSVVSHHFMSATELHTPLGQERLDACVFRVPVGLDLVPMCQVNAGGIRTTFYATEHTHRSQQPL